MLRYLVLGLILAVIVLRLLRSRWATRILRIPRRLLDAIHLVALTVAAVLAVLAEEWLLLGVLGALLLWALADVLRDRREARAAASTPARVRGQRTSSRPRG